MATAVKCRLKFNSSTKSWNRMSMKARAVALAKDVLKVLKLQRVKVKTGTYLSANIKCGVTADDAKAALAKEVKCSVCAKGGLLLARVLSRNAVSLGDIGGMNDWNGKMIVNADSEVCEDNLSDSFSSETLDAIEAAFEGFFVNSYEMSPQWKKKYRHPRERLTAIMKRIIRNKGRFDVSDVENP